MLRFSSVADPKVQGRFHVGKSPAAVQDGCTTHPIPRRQGMRSRSIITTALIAAAALILGVGTGASAQSARAKHISCTFELSSQGPPQGTPPRSVSFGLVACPRPFGNGVHYGSSAATPTGPGQGTVAVRFKKYFNRGTFKGTVAGTFAATSPMNISYQGKVTVTGGTGAFKKIKGGGTINCTSSDGGAHRSCRVKLTLKGI